MMTQICVNFLTQFAFQKISRHLKKKKVLGLMMCCREKSTKKISNGIYLM